MLETLGRHSTYPVCAVPIAALTPTAAADLIVDRASAGGAYEVHLCNAYTLSLVDDDVLLRDALNEADLNLPDGSPVAWLGRQFGTQGPVRGPDLMLDVARAGVEHGVRHYLYGGGGDGVADEVAARLQEAAPGIEIAGSECPPWTDLDDDEVNDLADRIKRTDASLVWIGLGTPRQDYLVRRLAPLVDCAVVPVGAAFDFHSGRVSEAPSLLHGSGFEWLYRLFKEPRRLWRRYTIGNFRFVRRAFKSRRAG